MEYDEIIFRWSASCICLNSMKLPSGGVPVICVYRMKLPSGGVPVVCDLIGEKLPSGGVPVVYV